MIGLILVTFSADPTLSTTRVSRYRSCGATVLSSLVERTLLGGKRWHAIAEARQKLGARENLQGHWTTTITPFLPDGEVDEAGIAKHVRILCS
jgi:hypothetical protein